MNTNIDFPPRTGPKTLDSNSTTPVPSAVIPFEMANAAANIKYVLQGSAVFMDSPISLIDCPFTVITINTTAPKHIAPTVPKFSKNVLIALAGRKFGTIKRATTQIKVANTIFCSRFNLLPFLLMIFSSILKFTFLHNNLVTKRSAGTKTILITIESSEKEPKFKVKDGSAAAIIPRPICKNT